MSDTLRVELAFEGGQAIRLRMTAPAVERLRRALTAGERWASVEEDGELVDVDLARVVYLRRSDEHRPGFSARN